MFVAFVVAPFLALSEVTLQQTPFTPPMLVLASCHSTHQRYAVVISATGNAQPKPLSKSFYIVLSW